MTRNSKVTGIVLAAGEGKRLRSRMPKVLHRVAGRPLLGHVLAALQPLELDRLIVVTSSRTDEIEAAISEAGWDTGVELVVQDPPLGTGDAARLALEALGPSTGVVIVVNGDSPLVTTGTFERLLDLHSSGDATATLLTAIVDEPFGPGRVVRGDGDRVAKVVEESDARADELTIREVNCGAYVFDAARLAELLPKVDRENAQGEYYLTDVVELLVSGGDVVLACLGDPTEAVGVNDRAQLAEAGELLRRRICEHWMLQGVSIVDPATTYIDATVEIAADATIMPFTFLEGDTHVAEGAEIGPQVRVIDSEIGPGASVSFAVIRGSTIGPDASVGPFASLRPGTRLERGARVGTFVETKETRLGEDSKANHLAYLGDAEIGRGVNVGAGTITTNWDGQKKHKTVIDDDAYIGSDTMLVAPTRIGKRAATGAGAVVRGDVPDDALAVGVPARIIEGKGNKMGRVERADSGEADSGEEDATPDS